ncbi:FAD-binding oxidoreductase [Streptomyces murinus]|uniref:NAD(P)/FAD-dependent oxidoreductase n=1 Tax=Streptomyces murinus TaxID=33900 RepID=UPI000A1FA8E4|nr:FAD-dependent oxidoreductase [Streptomyces murinus]WDO09733.1 FAD-binding oxidoreductase [Streptomyces murinus]
MSMPGEDTTAALDVVIVGAGIIGCLTARELMDAFPGATVAVVDRDQIGSGASRRSAGLHFPRGSSARVREMAALSERRYRELRLALPELPIHDVPTTVVAARSNADRLAEHYLPSADLTPVRRLPAGPADTVRLPPGSGAWSVRGGQYADVHGVAQLLAAELRPSVRFFEGARVLAIDSHADGVRLRLSTGETLAARQAVLALGPWTEDPAWRHWTAPLGLRVKKVVALHIERRPGPDDGVLVFEDEDAFLLPLHHRGHWLFSYTCAQWDVSPEGTHPNLSPVEIAEGRAVLERFAPGLARHGGTGRVFCDAYSPERAPVVRPVDEHHHVIFAGAANGSGYRLAPAIATETVAALGASGALDSVGAPGTPGSVRVVRS